MPEPTRPPLGGGVEGEPQAEVRRQLEDQRVVTLGRLARLSGDYRGIVDASRDSNADDEHDPEGSTIAFERSQVGALVAQAEAHLRDVDASLQRLTDGTYGRCETCGGAIPEERLAARPTARTCVGC